MIPFREYRGKIEGDYEGREEREARRTQKIFASFVVTFFRKGGMNGAHTAR